MLFLTFYVMAREFFLDKIHAKVTIARSSKKKRKICAKIKIVRFSLLNFFFQLNNI